MKSCRQEMDKSIRHMTCETVTFCKSVIDRSLSECRIARFLSAWLSVFYLRNSEYGVESVTTHGSQEPTHRKWNGQSPLSSQHSVSKKTAPSPSTLRCCESRVFFHCLLAEGMAADAGTSCQRLAPQLSFMEHNYQSAENIA